MICGLGGETVLRGGEEPPPRVDVEEVAELEA